MIVAATTATTAKTTGPRMPAAARAARTGRGCRVWAVASRTGRPAGGRFSAPSPAGRRLCSPTLCCMLMALLNRGWGPRPVVPQRREGLTGLLSGRRGDVAVDAEQVAGGVGGLDALEALVVGAVGGGGPGGVVLGQLEVDVVPPGREGPDPLPSIPGPGHMRIGGGAGWPGGVEPADVVGVAVADRPVVVLVVVEGAGEVEDDRLGQRRGDLQRALTEGVQEFARQAREELGLPVAVQPLGLHGIQHRLHGHIRLVAG